MPYESTIHFTLDTICPWTYLGLSRLLTALSNFSSSTNNPNGANPSTDSPVHFTILFHPFQLNPEMSSEGQDKYAWYRDQKYNSSAEQMEKYTKVMTHLGQQEAPAIPFDFNGTVANTLNAHRVIQYFQEAKGPVVTLKIVKSLYRQYFTERAHPASVETLLKACADAGIEEKEAKTVVEDEDEGLMEAKMAVREQVGNGVDAVPVVMIEGKRRDFTLQGAKEVEEYVKALEQVVRESG